jgi:hypothetical protein
MVGHIHSVYLIFQKFDVVLEFFKICALGRGDLTGDYELAGS